MDLVNNFLVKTPYTNTENKLLKETEDSHKKILQDYDELIKSYTLKLLKAPSEKLAKYLKEASVCNLVQDDTFETMVLESSASSDYSESDRSRDDMLYDLDSDEFVSRKKRSKKFEDAHAQMQEFDMLNFSVPESQAKAASIPTEALSLCYSRNGGGPPVFQGEQDVFKSLAISQNSSAAPQAFAFGAASQALVFGAAPRMPAFQGPGFFKSRKCNKRAFRDRLEFGEDEIDSIELSSMPVYHLKSYRSIFDEQEFHDMDKDREFIFNNNLENLIKMKMHLVNAVSTSLIYSPKYMNPEDPFRLLLMKCIEPLLSVDPEFLFKVALYTRQELHVRSTANFLLSYGAYQKQCRPYLRKYFSSSIRLPSDWINVAELYCTFSDGSLTTGSLPSALRKAMKSAFEKFDMYQLAKYNKKPKKKDKKDATCTSEGITALSSVTSDEDKKSFTLKKLIRILHITSPVEPVLCLLGKKYPKDPESFRQCNLPGIWDSQKAGLRMKLPVPETWETMISTCGNYSYVWETLIDNQKLPYMAMLRNLKNLIMSGISPAHHQKVLDYLSNKDSVVRSRQFPMSFYTAYKSVENIQSLVDKSVSIPSNLPGWKKKQMLKTAENIQNVDDAILKKYKVAINKALEISVVYNTDPIPGRTVVVCDLLVADDGQDKAFCNCLMLGLLSLKVCENCEMKVMSWNENLDDIHIEENTFLKNLERLDSFYRDTCSDLEEDEIMLNCFQILVNNYLNSNSSFTPKIDNFVILLCNPMPDSVKNLISDFLYKYRQTINPDLLFVQIDLFLSQNSFAVNENLFLKNDVYLCGFSDHVLKFIAERGGKKLLTYIENIDNKYKLEEIVKNLKKQDVLDTSLNSSVSPYFLTPTWKIIRIFVSSTFKDMHGERDILLRYVFPELKARASTIFVKINEIDLRWGITEEYSKSKRSAELCILEAQNCDLFIGILGNRYGSIYDFKPPDDPQFDWVKSYPVGSSITELEMQAGALNNPEASKSRAFFYFRHSSFMNSVPNKWLSWFSSEDADSEFKIEALKRRVRSSGIKVLDGYFCNWGGIYDGKPVAGGLDIFGQSVLDDLWNALCKLHGKESRVDEMEQEWNVQWSQCEEHKYFYGKDKLSITPYVNNFKSLNQGLFLITGKPGCGKTAFIVQLVEALKEEFVIPFFIGTSPRSTQVPYILEYIVSSIYKKLPVSTFLFKSRQDMLNHFSDVLLKGVNASPSGSLILIIDGLDHLDDSSQNLDWLPHNFPMGVKFICSTSDSSLAYKKLQNRKRYGYPIHFMTVNTLQISERQELVRNYLQQHRKTLDETSFNNQMLQLVTKMDSGSPLYLHLACDYLRMFATYENLMNTLQNFPSTLFYILHEIIAQLEKNYDSEIVRRTLTLICIVKEGISESELHTVVSASIKIKKQIDTSSSFKDIYSCVKEIQPEDMIPAVDYQSLLNMLRVFVCKYVRDGNFKVYSAQFLNVFVKYYLNKNDEYYIQQSHQFLAAYYMTWLDPDKRRMQEVLSPSVYRSLLFHLFNGQCFEMLVTTLCNFSFIKVGFKLHVSDDLLEYFTLLLNEDKRRLDYTNKRAKLFDCIKVQDYYSFVTKNAYILESSPHLVWQQALNEPVNSTVYKAVEYKALLIECLSKGNVNNRLLTVNFLKAITSASCHALEPVAAIGNEDGYLKIIDIYTGKVLKSQKGHSSVITSVCFVNKHTICTTSADNTLSIWDADDFFQIAVLKKHKRLISDCCPDPSGSILFSASWDCTVCLWSAQNGSHISTLDFRCPVNSVVHHPQLQEIACGLWNKQIEIWDTVSLKKKHVLYGHSGSVRSLAYNEDGLLLLSASAFLEVFIWSSSEGLQIGSLKGHNLPVNDIFYCKKDRLFITASDDCTLKVWPDNEVTSATTIKESKFCPIRFLEIVKPDTLAAAFENGVIQIYDILDGHEVASYNSSSDPVSSFGKYLETEILDDISLRSSDVEVILFGTKSGKIMSFDTMGVSTVLKEDIGAPVTSIIHAKHIILYGNFSGDLGVFYLKKDGPSFILPRAHESCITTLSLLIADDYKLVLSASMDMTVKLWKLSLDQNLGITFLQNINLVHQDYVTSCRFLRNKTLSSSNITVVTGSYDSTVAMRSLDGTEEVIFKGLETCVVTVYAIGKYIVGCAKDGSIAIWTRTGKLISKLSSVMQSSSVTAFDFQPGSDFSEFNIILACVLSDGSIDIKKPFERFHLCNLEGHSKPVLSCCANEIGNILSCSSDKTINIWQTQAEAGPVSHHSGSITSITFSNSKSYILSGDSHGVLMMTLFNTDDKGTPLKYVTHKKYVGCYITAVCWLNENRCICATSCYSNEQQKYCLRTLHCLEGSSSTECVYTLKEEHYSYLSSEITCIDYLHKNEIIVAALKNGEIFIKSSNHETQIKVSEDWIMKCYICDSVNADLFTIDAKGVLRNFHSALTLQPKSTGISPSSVFTLENKNGSPFWPTALCCDQLGISYVGNSKGWLYITSDSIKISKQAHCDAITGIFISGSHIVTSSLDKTVKIWKSSSFNQVSEFHSHLPLTCLAVKELPGFGSSVLLIAAGTTQGVINLLKWIP